MFASALPGKLKMWNAVSDVGSFVRMWQAGRAFARQRRAVQSPSPSGSESDLLPIRVRSLGGHKVYLRRGSTDIAVFWETFVQRFFLLPQELLPSSVEYIIDLGCYTGLGTLAFAKWFPQARIFGVDASTKNMALARRNVGEHPEADRIRLMHAAVWSEDADVLFDEACDESWAYKVEPNAQHGVPVPGRRLTSVIRESGFPRVDFLKANIEGAERALLDDADQWAPYVHTFVCTFHDDVDFNTFADRLTPLGYKCLPPESLPGQYASVAVRQTPA
ncbi:MAG: FkbM family methyltransferase [Phycisphaerae bacterium]|nr:FkbM family methyltransferase [Phycisphaerae bacterium]